jgi:hypothetical protein
MPRGRPRKPIEQHLHDATFRGDRHVVAPAMNMTPGGDAVAKPAGLAGKAGELWDIVANRYALKDTDAPELVACCKFFDRYWVCWDTYEKTKPGTKRALLVQREANDNWKRFEIIAGKYGLTPSERAKLGLGSFGKPQGGGVRCRLHA